MLKIINHNDDYIYSNEKEAKVFIYVFPHIQWRRPINHMYSEHIRNCRKPWVT